MGKEEEEILLKFYADGNVPEYLESVQEAFDRTSVFAKKFGTDGKEALDQVDFALEEMDAKAQAIFDAVDASAQGAADSIIKVADAAGGAIPPFNNFGAALMSGGDDMSYFTDGIMMLSVALRNLNPDVTALVEKQLALVTSNLELAQKFLDAAVAGNAENAAIASLTATVDTLTAQATQLGQAQDFLNLTMAAAAPPLGVMDTALMSLNEAFAASNVHIQEQIDKQVANAKVSLAAAEATLALAQSQGAATSVVDAYQATIDALTAKIATLTQQQAILNDNVLGVSSGFYNQSVATDILITALDGMSGSILDVINKELALVDAAGKEAQILYNSTDATLIGADAYDRLGIKLQELKDRYLALADAQKMAQDAGLSAAAVPAPKGPGGAGGGASGGTPNTTNDKQGNAFMLLMLAMAAYQVGKAFVDMGVKADQALTTMHDMTGMSTADLAILTSGMEALGVKTGYNLDTMATAMYKVYSVFGNTADSMLVMDAAAKLARAGNADLTATSDALITTMTAFHDPASQAAKDAGDMHIAMLYGKETMGEFATHIAIIASVAHEAGMGLAETAQDQALLSLQMHNGSLAAKELSALIRAVGIDIPAVGQKAMNLGLDFDKVKFQTLDWAGKLEFLQKMTGGNAQQIQTLVGGAGVLKTAMGNLGLTTAQIATNAQTAGLSFDGTKYSAMNLAGKLEYLLQVSGGNEKHFLSLVGGAKNLNDAFKDLDLSTTDVAVTAHKLGYNFDEAHYKTLPLIDKLRMLREMTHGNDADFKKLMGTSSSYAAALMLLNTPVEKVTLIHDRMKTGVEALNLAFSEAMTSIGAKGAQLGAAIQNMAYNFLQAIKPELTAFLQGLGNVMDFLGQHMDIVLPIVVGLSLALGILMVGAIIAVLGTMSAFFTAAAPFILIGLAIGAVATVIAQHWNQLAPLWPFLAGAIAAVTTALIGINAQAILLAITSIPANIAALGLWAAGMWTTFIAEMALIGPWLLIGLAVGAAVVLIILAIQHWGAVMDWITFKTHASALSAEADATQQRITAVDQANRQADGVIAALQRQRQGLIDVMNKTTNDAKKAALQKQLDANAAALAFQLHTKEAYAKQEGLLKQHLADVKAQQALADRTAELQQQAVHGVSTDALRVVFGTWGGMWNNFWGNLLKGQINTDQKQQSQQDDADNKRVAANWAALGKMLTDWRIWSDTLITNMNNWTNNLAISLFQGGAHMIQQFAAGIASATQNVVAAVANIAATVAGYLHHSKPDFGPMAHDDEWMPHFGTLLEQGMLSNIPKLQAASHKLALAAGSGLSVPSSSASVLGTGQQSQLVGVLSQILGTLQRQTQTGSQIGSPATRAGLSAITQQFGSVNINGVNNPMQLYRQLNALAGLAQEYGDRGATGGLGV